LGTITEIKRALQSIADSLSWKYQI
jgi:hypothetical protein